MNIRKLFRKAEEAPCCSAVIVAAGSAQRMGSDKIMGALGGLPVLIRTLLPFEHTDIVQEIIVVTRQEKLEHVADLCKKYEISKVSKVICGGNSRMESALAGVSEVNSRAKLIAIHDGARPLVTEALIRRVVQAAYEHLAAVPVLHCVDTMKCLDEEGKLCGDVDRDLTVRIQTPQVFDAALIKGALTRAVKGQEVCTDDSSALEKLGVTIYSVPGEEENIKLTTPLDRVLAEAILRNRGTTDADRTWI